jgi:hypothetical protein
MNKMLLYVLFLPAASIISTQGCGTVDNTNYQSKRIIKRATITLNGNINDVLPLFGAREEQKWEPRWKPEFIYPQDKKDEKHNVFKTEHSSGDNHQSVVSYWVMTEFSKELRKVSYAVFSGHHITTISIQCDATSDSTTSAVVEYVMTGLDDHGNELIELKAERIFSHNLADWEDAINQCLRRTSI